MFTAFDIIYLVVAIFIAQFAYDITLSLWDYYVAEPRRQLKKFKEIVKDLKKKNLDIGQFDWNKFLSLAVSIISDTNKEEISLYFKDLMKGSEEKEDFVRSPKHFNSERPRKE